MAGNEEWAEPVEIVDGDASTTEIEAGGTVDWHKTVRTGAAVVAALSLLWIGRSMADQRAGERQRNCHFEVQNAYSFHQQRAHERTNYSGPAVLSDDLVAELVEQARACGGNDIWADALEMEQVAAEDDDT